MRVTHVVRQYKPAVGGLENAVDQLAHALIPHGVFSSIVTLDRVFSDKGTKLASNQVYRGVNVARIPFHGSSRYPIAPSVLSHIADADLVHVHGIDFFFDYLALTQLIHRKKLVASTHGGFFHTQFAAKLKVAYFGTITRASASAYEAIIASSMSDAKTFSRIARSSTVLIENGVDTEKWKASASAHLRRSLIYIGRFSENKNILSLVDLLSSLANVDSTWTLNIVGVEGFLTKNMIMSYANNLGVAAQVEVHCNLSDEEIAVIIRQCSYISSASTYEGFGLSVVEGMAAGLIPVLSQIPPFEKLVRESGDGVIFDPADILNSANKIERLHVESSVEASAIRTRVSAFAQRYSWSKVGVDFANLYRSLTERPDL